MSHTFVSDHHHVTVESFAQVANSDYALRVWSGLAPGKTGELQLDGFEKILLENGIKALANESQRKKLILLAAAQVNTFE